MADNINLIRGASNLFLCDNQLKIGNKLTNKQMDETNKQQGCMCETCKNHRMVTCDCSGNCCGMRGAGCYGGYGSYHGGFYVLKFILGLIIVAMIFCIGVKIGKHISCNNWHGGYGRGMMEFNVPNMMYQGVQSGSATIQALPLQPTTGSTTTQPVGPGYRIMK